MLEFSAHRYIAIGDFLQRMASILALDFPNLEPINIPEFADAQQRAKLERENTERKNISAELADNRVSAIAAILPQLPLIRDECTSLGMASSVAQINRFLASYASSPASMSAQLLMELSTRIHDDLEGRAFLALDFTEQELYKNPRKEWARVIDRFPRAVDDIEEAGKCLSLERYAASIFHLMRLTEAAVIELGKVVDPSDYKPQFSSVLKKIDTLVQKTKWQDWPESARPHKPLFVDVLPRLYAVKDSWRDKVSHFSEHIVPTEAIANREQARDIYNCTLSLMRLLADRLT